MQSKLPIMPSLLQTTINSMLIRGAANLTAQLSQPRPNGLDYFRILQFVIFGLTSAPINTYWQRFLEDTFPTHTKSKPEQRKGKSANSKTDQSKDDTSLSNVNWLNVVIKVALDQIIGLTFLNIIFLIILNVEHLDDPQVLMGIVQQRIGPVLRAGWKIWPIVALTNFVFVPVESRVLLISCVGFGWNIFLSFFERK